MRSLKRNQVKIYYSTYTKDATTDKNGNKVGKWESPVELMISLSANKGEAEMQPFGRSVDYDREMVTTDMSCPITELSNLWIGIPTTEKHNYIVTKVAPSLNQIRYAIKQVKVS